MIDRFAYVSTSVSYVLKEKKYKAYNDIIAHDQNIIKKKQKKTCNPKRQPSKKFNKLLAISLCWMCTIYSVWINVNCVIKTMYFLGNYCQINFDVRL